MSFSKLNSKAIVVSSEIRNSVKSVVCQIQSDYTFVGRDHNVISSITFEPWKNLSGPSLPVT